MQFGSNLRLLRQLIVGDGRGVLAQRDVQPLVVLQQTKLPVATVASLGLAVP